MKKIEYSFGSGTGTIFVAMRAKKIYFCLNSKDREELHRIYGGKQYYWSRSGASGAGFLTPKENDLLEVTGHYRAGITHLSEAYPTEMFGVNIMFSVEGIDLYKSPVVAEKNGIIYLLNEEQAVSALMGGLPEEYRHEISYKYLTRNGEVRNFNIPWVGDGAFNSRNNRPCYLPYTFEEFAQTMGAVPNDIYSAEVLKEEVSFIERKLYLAKTEAGLARIGHFGLPVEKIDGELFPQDSPRSLFGWSTQGFGPYQVAWKRVSDGGNKIYAIIQVIPGQLSEKYSLLGDTPMEYELLVENVLGWFSKPVTEWVEEMKSELLRKIRTEFLNSARWDKGLQKEKVRELLEANPETLFEVGDSLAVGNCRPGTESWMKDFGLTEPVTGKQLLEHQKFEDMLKNSRFRAVVINKLYDGAILVGSHRADEDEEEVEIVETDE